VVTSTELKIGVDVSWHIQLTKSIKPTMRSSTLNAAKKPLKKSTRLSALTTLSCEISLSGERVLILKTLLS
jgi:hypothetical protein